MRDRFGAGIVFVSLAAVTDPGLALAAIGQAAGAHLTGTGSTLEALAEQFSDDPWLLILDNLEQVVEVADDLGELLSRCPGLAILATSRTVLGLRAEREYPVPPLPLPADSASAAVDDVAASPAVALFVDRAQAVRPGFALTEGNAAAVAEICRRLEGLPLAIELAAARIRLLDPGVLLGRLAASLDALGTGAVDLPERRVLRVASASLDELRRQDEPFWTAQAGAALAALEMAVGRYDDALLHLREMRDMADRFDYVWLAAWDRVQMATVATRQGRLDDARQVLDEALDLSLAIASARNVTLCLTAFARLALADGDPERAALVAGAAEELRRRASLRSWPVLRQDEANLLTQIRQAMPTDRFSEIFSAGAQLSQREAVAVVRDRRGTGSPAT